MTKDRKSNTPPPRKDKKVHQSRWDMCQRSRRWVRNSLLLWWKDDWWRNPWKSIQIERIEKGDILEGKSDYLPRKLGWARGRFCLQFLLEGLCMVLWDLCKLDWEQKPTFKYLKMDKVGCPSVSVANARLQSQTEEARFGICRMKQGWVETVVSRSMDKLSVWNEEVRATQFAWRRGNENNSLKIVPWVGDSEIYILRRHFEPEISRNPSGGQKLL